ncbi:MAG TPA: helix-turn-helix domain-containing protein [Phycisphaerae bacterium]|nr:helix-turn-helix domain-containing protein [Phycisphaerae bacterium]
MITTRQAAQALGVSEASVKRWCDQGLLAAVRTPGGHRRLPVTGVVRFVREQRLELVRPGLLGLPGLTARAGQGPERLRSVMQAALAGADENEAGGLLFGLYLAGTPAAEILDDLIAPAFRALGDQWAHGELAVYEERRAVEMCTRLLHQLRMFLPSPAPDAPQAIGGTLAGDPYSLPTMMLELALREVGWRAESYGCGHPAATLADALRNVRPRVLWLSVSSFESEQQLVADCASLYAAAQESGAALLVGGRMLTAELRERIDYSAHGDNLRHAVTFAQALQPPCRPAAAAEGDQ